MVSNNNLLVRLLDTTHRGGIHLLQIANLLNVSRRTVYDWITKGDIPERHYDAVTTLINKIETAIENGRLPIDSSQAIKEGLRTILELN